MSRKNDAKNIKKYMKNTRVVPNSRQIHPKIGLQLGDWKLEAGDRNTENRDPNLGNGDWNPENWHWDPGKWRLDAGNGARMLGPGHGGGCRT